ncbi:hypothetical protein F5141DRAFT_1218310 [Pisolithus sp. B1]|nr:hypothetical protein F5141DRAFT_1218310 [Pisolithus sp. B1]
MRVCEPLPTTNSCGIHMTTLGAKYMRSRQLSQVTTICTLKDVDLEMMGPDKMTPAYGHGGKKQRCADDTYSSHQRVTPCSGTGSTSSLERRYSSTATSEEYHDDSDEDCSDVDEEYVTEPRQASVGVPMTLAPLPPPSVSYTVENEALLADHPTHSVLSPLVPSDTSVTFSHGHMRRYAFNPPPKPCSLIPSFCGSAASEAELAYSASESGYPVSRAEEFQWDFPDPFNTPTTDSTCTFAMARYAKMRLNDNVAPDMDGDSKIWEHLPPPPPPPSPFPPDGETENGRFQTPVPRPSLGAVGGGTQLGTLQLTSIPSRPASLWGGYESPVSRSSSISSDDTRSFALCRADLVEYVNTMLRAQETREAKEAIAEGLRGREKLL